MAKGICERIGIEGSKILQKADGKPEYELVKDMKDHSDAIKMVIDALTSSEYGVISSMSEIDAVGHRVLHGGKYYSASTIVTEDVKKVIRDCFDLGPLHNPANLTGIEACEKAMPVHRRLLYSIPLSVSRWTKKFIHTLFLTNTMKNML